MANVENYKEQLYRGVDTFMSFSFGFIEVGGLACLVGLFGYGLITGGPGPMVWGWIVSFIATMFVAYSMAELCSVFPFAGSVYNWAGNVSNPEWSPFAAYWTGLSNWLGNAAADASVAYFFATTLSSALEITGLTGFSDNYQIVGVSVAVLFIWTLLNCFRVDQIGWLINLGSVINILFTLTMVICLFSLSPSLNSPQYVFFDYNNETGITSKSYVFAISLLFSLFSFAGYDGSAHLAEETLDFGESNSNQGTDAQGLQISQTPSPAPNAAAVSLIYCCYATGITGFIIILSLLFAMQNIQDAIDSENAPIEITVQALGQTMGSVLAWTLVFIIFQTGVSSVTVTARITFALCRDGLFPYSDTLVQVNPYFKSPIYICWFLFFFDLLLLAVALLSTTGFLSITGISVIGFQISYGLPIFIRVINPTDKLNALLRSTPMSLGSWSWSIGLISSAWLFGTSILFFLPNLSPITSENMNYSSVIVTTLLILGSINWECNSKLSYHGPLRVVDELYDKLKQNQQGEEKNKQLDKIDQSVVQSQSFLDQWTSAKSGSNHTLTEQTPLLSSD